MKLKNLTLLIIVLLVADQALKIWVKTHMQLDEAIIVFPDWFQLRFIENKGAAYGMHIASSGAFDWGKLLLGIFRIALSCLHEIRKALVKFHGLSGVLHSHMHSPSLPSEKQVLFPQLLILLSRFQGIFQFLLQQVCVLYHLDEVHLV